MTEWKILLVDDEPVVLRVIRLALEKAGYQVETRPNGLAALERIREQPPDVLITDIEMPQMSGQELCQKLEAEMPDRRFPIFVATSLTGLEHRGWSQSIPRLVFLEKPLSARKLVKTLNDYFEDQAARTTQILGEAT